MPKKPAPKFAKKIGKKISKPIAPKVAKAVKAGPAMPSKDSDGGAMGSLMPKIKR